MRECIKIANKNASDILFAIINKGGIMGEIAKTYTTEETKAIKFILECSQQCHSRSVQKLWGKKLVRDILEFCSSYRETNSLAYS